MDRIFSDFFRVLFLFLLTGFQLSHSNTSTLAQGATPLQAHQKSVLVFDIRFDQLVSEANSLGLSNEELDKLNLRLLFKSFFADNKLSELKRVYGAVSLPKDLASLRDLYKRNTNYPFEFFFRAELTSDTAANKMKENFSRNTQTVELGGQKFQKLTDRRYGIFARRLTNASFEFGTPVYCQQPNRAFYTTKLKEVFSSTTGNPLRVAMEMESRSDFAEEIGILPADEATPNEKLLIYTLTLSSSAVATTNFSNGNLLNVVIKTKDEEGAMRLKSIFDPALESMQQELLGDIRRAEKESSTQAKAATEIIQSAVISQTGNSVTLSIQNAGSLIKDVSDLLAKFRQAKKLEEKNNFIPNSFKMLAIAADNYEANWKGYPFQTTQEYESKELSWRVRLLEAWTGDNNLMSARSNKGPKDEPNLSLTDQMPSAYGPGGKLSNVSWIKSNVRSSKDVLDGKSKTVMLIEFPKGKPWLEQNPLTIDEAIELVSTLKDGHSLHVIFYDGVVRKVSNKIPKKALRLLFDPQDKTPFELADIPFEK
ncbi:MAG: hypothetical protein AB8B55_22180 [Mariniblastus sp.]